MTTLPTSRRTWLSLGAGLLVLIGSVLMWTADVLSSGTPSGSLDQITRFLLVLAVILMVCHLLGELMRRLGQPPVLGEMLGGVLLGPSALGLVWPAAMRWLAAPAVLDTMDKVGQLGLVVFMFLLGCELRTDRIERPRLVAATVLGGMGLPFVVGVGLACGLGSLLAPHGTAPTSYALFLGLALSVTALPVLARVLVDLRIDQTRVGALSMSSAAVGDGVAWLVLTFILTGTGQGGSTSMAETAYLAMALMAVTVLCVRPALAVLVRRMRSEQLLTVVLLAGAIAFSGMTQAINLHPVIGAFLFGVVVPRDSEKVQRIGHQLRGFTLIVLLPVFFAGVGLGTSIGLIGGSPLNWLVFAVVLAAAVLTKFLGAGGAARLAGLPRKQSVRLATLMNCRGVTELVIATIGFKAGLINQLCFTVLVLIAVVTTAATGPLMRRLIRNDPAVDGPAPEPVRPVAT
ncbi:cation:proton antiporter [Streptomyces sp. NPDC058773]|uniref:cation:proton antiporter n=1 Tax=Streptomyces sp. NPDC058773 TaxID=3346632 RepID=UPI0036CDC5AF